MANMKGSRARNHRGRQQQQHQQEQAVNEAMAAAGATWPQHIPPTPTVYVAPQPGRSPRGGSVGDDSSGGGATRRIRTPNANDVLCGRGGGINSHPGNRRFRDWVKERKESYNLAKSKSDKARESRKIVDRVRSLDPPGRFLMRADDGKATGTGASVFNGFWVEIDDVKAMAKTSQALREGAPTIRAMHKQLIDEGDSTDEARKKVAATIQKQVAIRSRDEEALIYKEMREQEDAIQNAGDYAAEQVRREAAEAAPRKTVTKKTKPRSSSSRSKNSRGKAKRASSTTVPPTTVPSVPLSYPSVGGVVGGVTTARALATAVKGARAAAQAEAGTGSSTGLPLPPLVASRDFHATMAEVASAIPPTPPSNKRRRITADGDWAKRGAGGGGGGGGDVDEDKNEKEFARQMALERSMAPTPPLMEAPTPTLMPIPTTPLTPLTPIAGPGFLSPQPTAGGGGLGTGPDAAFSPIFSNHQLLGGSHGSNGNNHVPPSPPVKDPRKSGNGRVSGKSGNNFKREHSLALSDVSGFNDFDANAEFHNPFENERDMLAQLKPRALEGVYSGPAVSPIAPTSPIPPGQQQQQQQRGGTGGVDGGGGKAVAAPARVGKKTGGGITIAPPSPPVVPAPAAAASRGKDGGSGRGAGVGTGLSLSSSSAHVSRTNSSVSGGSRRTGGTGGTSRKDGKSKSFRSVSTVEAGAMKIPADLPLDPGKSRSNLTSRIYRK